MPSKLTKSFTIDSWLTLRNRLQDKAVLNDDWAQASKLLEERIDERYFQPINTLINEASNNGAGFTILTIECALIEFLATLEDGRLFKRDKLPSDSQCFYNRSAKIYNGFLRSAEVFQGYFSAKDGQKSLLTAFDFYQNVRCPLIHEAQTKNKWEVRIFGGTKITDQKNRVPFAVDKAGTKIIYRTALLHTLETYFQFYLNTVLTQQDNKGRIKRKYLARKIDHIAELTPDNKWWWTK
jgi:hypothetical protein